MNYMTATDTRILTYLGTPGRPPQTALQIAQGIYGPQANANAVHAVLLALVQGGRLTRAGKGWKSDPYRYKVVT